MGEKQVKVSAIVSLWKGKKTDEPSRRQQLWMV
jgi:hypothetical protein